MSDTQPIDLNSDALGTPSEGAADPFNGHIDGFRILQRSDYWIGIAWNKHEGPWCFRRGRTEEQRAASRHRLHAPVWSSV
jgi:hypothetical protein